MKSPKRKLYNPNTHELISKKKMRALRSLIALIGREQFTEIARSLRIWMRDRQSDQ